MQFGKRYTTETFYEGKVSKTVVEVEPEHFTDRDALLKDIIEALMVLTSGQSDKLTLEICIDKYGRYKLKQRSKEVL